jgi:soluble lytic murein transglycosylase
MSHPFPRFLVAALLFCLLVPAAAGGPSRLAGPDPLHSRAALLERQLVERAGSRIPGPVRSNLARTIVAEAHLHGIEPALVLAMIDVESSFRPAAVSHSGAYGLMQIRARTGAATARRLGIEWRGEEQTLCDPIANVRIGIAYLARLRDRFDSLPIALAAYNQGPTRVSSKLGRGEPVAASYSRRVMRALAGLPDGSPS